MAFVSDQSCECAKSELDIFAVPPTQTSVLQAEYIEYQPLTSILGNAPIEFNIIGNGENYIDLANVLLYVRAKIIRNNNADLQGDSTVGPVNLMLHSMFSQVDVSLNDTLISSSTNTYPYKAMLETLLSYGEDAKKSQLTSEMFYKDDAGRMDEVVTTAAGDHVPNEGLNQRRALVTTSRVFDMMGRLHSDMFMQDRYLLNEVGVKIKLIRSRDNFCLMGDADGKLIVTHASLFVRKVKLSPSVFLAHAKALESNTAKYPIKRVVCKSFAIPANYLDSNHEKLFSGQLPTRIVVGFVDNRGFNGSRAHNPFNFHHYQLNEISIYLDGHQQYALKPLQPNFANGLYVRTYNSLFAGTNKLNRDEGNFITRKDYPNGYCLYAFDLTADLAEDDYFNLVKQGSVRLSMKFAQALPHTVSVVAYAEFDNIVEIDRGRNLLVDFGV